MDNNETDNFLDGTENKKQNNVAIVIILYLIVIILAALMIFGLKNQKKIVKENLTKNNQEIKQNNDNSKDKTNNSDKTDSTPEEKSVISGDDNSNETNTLEQSINTINKEKEDMKESVTDLESNIQEYFR